MIHHEIRKTFDNYRKILREIDSLANQWDAEVKECDQAFGDVRHFCEKNKRLDRATKTKITKLIAEYSERRRVAKDNLIVLDQFISYGRSHGNVLSELDRIAGDIKKQTNYVEGQRVYNPRVLKDLFESKVAQ